MVAIKGFKMPNSCDECPLNYDTLACMAGYGNPEGPDIDRVTYKGKPWEYCKERHPACPLVEFPREWLLTINNSRTILDHAGAAGNL